MKVASVFPPRAKFICGDVLPAEHRRRRPDPTSSFVPRRRSHAVDLAKPLTPSSGGERKGVTCKQTSSYEAQVRSSVRSKLLLSV